MENNLEFKNENEFNKTRIDWWIEINSGTAEVSTRPFQYIEDAKMEIKEGLSPVSVTVTIKNHGI